MSQAEMINDNDLCPNMTATYSPQDNKLRLYTVNRLDDETYAQAKKLGFKWAPRQGFFVAPMWTPVREDWLISLCGHIENETSTREERAADRAARFENYSAKREAEANQTREQVNRISSFIPLGQPILVGHHSEARHRRDIQRMHDGMSKAVNLWKTSEYWEERARASLAHAENLERPDVRYRRIKKLESERRKFQRTIDGHTKALALWSKSGLDAEQVLDLANRETYFGVHFSFKFSLEKYPRSENTYEGGRSIWSALNDNIIGHEKAVALMVPALERVIAHAKRWVEHYTNRIAYERAMLGDTSNAEKAPLVPSQTWNIEPGGFITTNLRFDSGLELPVIRVNKKDGIMQSVTVKGRYGKRITSAEEITGYIPPTTESAAAVKKATSKPPIVNYPCEGFKEITRKDWSDTHQDYKDVRLERANAEHGPYRYRTMMWHENGRTMFGRVYITDQKEVPVPPVEE